MRGASLAVRERDDNGMIANEYLLLSNISNYIPDWCLYGQHLAKTFTITTTTSTAAYVFSRETHNLLLKNKQKQK